MPGRLLQRFRSRARIQVPPAQLAAAAARSGQPLRDEQTAAAPPRRRSAGTASTAAGADPDTRITTPQVAAFGPVPGAHGRPPGRDGPVPHPRVHSSDRYWGQNHIPEPRAPISSGCARAGRASARHARPAIGTCMWAKRSGLRILSLTCWRGSGRTARPPRRRRGASPAGNAAPASGRDTVRRASSVQRPHRTGRAPGWRARPAGTAWPRSWSAVPVRRGRNPARSRRRR